MISLMCAGPRLTREELRSLETPEGSRTHRPIPHSAVIDQLCSRLDRYGFKIEEEAFGTTHEHNRMFGLLRVTDQKAREDHSLLIGARNAHDMSMSAEYALGQHVTVCSNMSFSGLVKVSRKHTRYCLRDLPSRVATAVGKLAEHAVQQDTRFDAYREAKINDPIAHDLLIRAVDAKAVPVSKLRAVLGEWRKPSHDAFKARTLWSLFNAVTEVAKPRPIGAVMTETTRLHGLFDRHVGLSIN